MSNLTEAVRSAIMNRLKEDDKHLFVAYDSTSEVTVDGEINIDAVADDVIVACAEHKQREIDELAAQVETYAVALSTFMEVVEMPPDRNCSCHISPPCNDCVDYAGLREAFSMGASALSTTPSEALREIEARVLEEIAAGWDIDKVFTAEQIEQEIRREARAKRKGA